MSTARTEPGRSGPSGDDARLLAWRAATLTERLRATAGGVPADTATVRQVLSAWTRSLGGDPAVLARRMAWDRIDASALSSALASRPPSSFPTPPWIHWLDRFAAECRSAERSDAGVAVDVPFGDAWAPILEAARRLFERELERVAVAVPREAVACALRRQLLKELSAVGELTLLDEFRTPASEGSVTPASANRHDSFVRQLAAGGWPALFDRYPVLARHVCLLSQAWVDASVEMLKRLAADAGPLARRFGRPADDLVGLHPGLSDRHAGRRVAALEFASGLRLVYKPRDLALEESFNRLLAWLLERDCPVPAPLAVLAGDGYGWVEQASHERFEAAADVRQYFVRAGGLLAVADLLQGADLHAENIVATLAGPRLVDPEMLLQPRRESPSPARGEQADGPAGTRGSVATGLVSLVRSDAAGRAYDVGGLRQMAPRTGVLGRRRWHDIGSDAIGYEVDRELAPIVSNQVRLDCEAVSPVDHVDGLVEGYRRTYQELMRQAGALRAPGGPLSWFADVTTRVVLRQSDQYGALLYLLAAPRYQVSGIDRSLALETLLRPFAHDDTRPALWPLLEDEREMLERLDVPRALVSSSGTTMVARSGEVVRGHIGQSGADAAADRLATLSSADLEWQIELIRAALRPGGAGPRHAASDESPEGDAALVGAAQVIGELLLARAVGGPGGTLAWRGCHGRADLYGGHAGVALFLAALARSTGEARFREAALGAFEGLDARIRNQEHPPAALGLTGWSSALYACLVSRGLAGWDGRALATLMARRVEPHLADPAAKLDVEGGLAGTVLFLVRLHQETGDETALGLAREGGVRLLAAAVDAGAGGRAWRDGDGRVRAGFAHGQSGIVVALDALSRVTRAPDLLETIPRALAVERGLYSGPHATWPAYTADGRAVVMTAWCQGAPGIAVARASLAQDGRAGGDALRSDVDAAVRATLDAAPAAFDHACCGTAGRLEALVLAGRRFGRRDWIEAGRAAARAVAHRILRDGAPGVRARAYDTGAPEVGFFQGMAGIGYQLLRTADPAAIPSVLGLELSEGEGS